MPETPNNGPTHGRVRSTMKELFKNQQRADVFPFSPSDQAAFGIANRSMGLAHQNTLSGLKAQADMIREQYKYAKTAANEGAQYDAARMQGSIAERGLIGSTNHQAGVQEIAGAREAEIGQALMNRQQGLLGVNQGRLDAWSQLLLGRSDLMLQRAAAQRQMTLAALGSGGANPWGL